MTQHVSCGQETCYVQKFLGSPVHTHGVTHTTKFVRWSSEITEKMFYRVDHTHGIYGHFFLTRMLTRDLFTVS